MFFLDYIIQYNKLFFLIFRLFEKIYSIFCKSTQTKAVTQAVHLNSQKYRKKYQTNCFLQFLEKKIHKTWSPLLFHNSPSFKCLKNQKNKKFLFQFRKISNLNVWLMNHAMNRSFLNIIVLLSAHLLVSCLLCPQK